MVLIVLLDLDADRLYLHKDRRSLILLNTKLSAHLANGNYLSMKVRLKKDSQSVKTRYIQPCSSLELLISGPIIRLKSGTLSK